MAKKPVAPPKKKAPAYPSAKAGNYRAPVDTTGMDPEMKATLGIKPAKPVRRGGKRGS